MPRGDAPGLVLGGLDGGNPLGFLAAVGTLRTVALAEPSADWRMKWVGRQGTWLPELSADRFLCRDSLVEMVVPRLRIESTPEFEFNRNLTVSPKDFRKVANQAQCRASRHDRRYADFIASFGCETVISDDRKKIQDTALRTMSGAGHQHFLGTMKDLVKKTRKSDLRQSLFETWHYTNNKLGLRWDPEEDRRYALRWDNPSGGDGVPTMRGANRLAVEALPLLPAVPVGRRLETTGFARHEWTVRFTWPIWECALGLDVIRSLLAIDEIQEVEPRRTRLQSMGVVEVYRSQRFTNGRYRNFARAHPA